MLTLREYSQAARGYEHVHAVHCPGWGHARMRKRVSSILTLAGRAWASTDYGDCRSECVFSPSSVYLRCSYFYLYDQSGILSGVMPDDVMGPSGTTQKVRERLAEYIGNLEAVQAANSQGRTLKAEVPVREYTIESWNVEDYERSVIAYGLL